MLLRKRSEQAEPTAEATAPRGLIRRARGARRTIRLRLSTHDLAPIGDDIDRLLQDADDLALSPESRELFLALDDEISQDIAGAGGEPERQDGPAGRLTRRPAATRGDMRDEARDEERSGDGPASGHAPRE